MNKFIQLKKIIKKYKNILIMTHKNPDLDGFSSCLAMQDILTKFNIDSEVYLNETNLDITIIKTLEILKKNYKFAYDMSKKYDLLIIIDVNKKNLLENEEAFDIIENTLIIDHHIKGFGYIEATYEICDPKYSSVSEMMVEFLSYLKINLCKDLYTCLLAGMEIDTNGFSVRVTSNTFKIAAVLLDKGADLVFKQKLLKENRDEYIKQQYFIKNSLFYNNTMICMLDNNKYDKKYLAMISEELLQFEDVEASFTIGYIDDNIIGISARSIGNIDVEKIMNHFNGGGHTTNAAAQVNAKSKNEIKNELLTIIGG